MKRTLLFGLLTMLTASGVGVLPSLASLGYQYGHGKSLGHHLIPIRVALVDQPMNGFLSANSN